MLYADSFVKSGHEATGLACGRGSQRFQIDEGTDKQYCSYGSNCEGHFRRWIVPACVSGINRQAILTGDKIPYT